MIHFFNRIGCLQPLHKKHGYRFCSNLIQKNEVICIMSM
jgi:hypothetical protein